jgi:hypothetical protein
MFLGKRRVWHKELLRNSLTIGNPTMLVFTITECFQLAIGQSKSCFSKIDLSNEHDGGTNLSE